MRFPPTKRLLIETLSDGRFHSGTMLAQTLGLSRTAVWELIHEVEALGLEVHAVQGKGYRLAAAVELLDRDAIRNQLSERTRELLTELDIHDRLDSTNAHLMNRAREGAPAGSVCLAESQSAGKGRLGRAWLSPYAGGIALSMLWRFEDYAHISGLSLAIGVGVMRVLRRAGIENAGIKWPNDILWQDAKLGGILLEAAGEAHGGCAVVVGLGLNMRIPAGLGQTIDQVWTDLDRIGPGCGQARNRWVALLLDELLPLLADYPNRGLAYYLDEWRGYHCLEGRTVTVHRGDRLTRGRVVGVNPEGLLLVEEDETGAQYAFASGDVQVRASHD